jgi:GNAT superfamily N-acetyltransferase
MLLIRDYYEKSDSTAVGRLIARTSNEINPTFAPTEERDHDLAPLLFASSLENRHQAAIARLIWADKVYVAEEDGEMAGVLRGEKKDCGRILSLYVRGEYHWDGIGRKLVERFEQDCEWDQVPLIKVASTLYAVPFYRCLGYKRSTGIRSGFHREGRGFIYQPMKKYL